MPSSSSKTSDPSSTKRKYSTTVANDSFSSPKKKQGTTTKELLTSHRTTVAQAYDLGEASLLSQQQQEQDAWDRSMNMPFSPYVNSHCPWSEPPDTPASSSDAFETTSHSLVQSGSASLDGPFFSSSAGGTHSSAPTMIAAAAAAAAAPHHTDSPEAVYSALFPMAASAGAARSSQLSHDALQGISLSYCSTSVPVATTSTAAALDPSQGYRYQPLNRRRRRHRQVYSYNNRCFNPTTNATATAYQYPKLTMGTTPPPQATPSAAVDKVQLPSPRRPATTPMNHVTLASSDVGVTEGPPVPGKDASTAATSISTSAAPMPQRVTPKNCSDDGNDDAFLDGTDNKARDSNLAKNQTPDNLHGAKVFVVFKTLHRPDPNVIRTKGSELFHLLQQCTAQSFVCGILTTREHADKVLAAEREYFDTVTHTFGGSQKSIYHLNDGSLPTTFAVHEMKVNVPATGWYRTPVFDEWHRPRRTATGRSQDDDDAKKSVGGAHAHRCANHGGGEVDAGSLKSREESATATSKHGENCRGEEEREASDCCAHPHPWKEDAYVDLCEDDSSYRESSSDWGRGGVGKYDDVNSDAACRCDESDGSIGDKENEGSTIF